MLRDSENFDNEIALLLLMGKPKCFEEGGDRVFIRMPQPPKKLHILAPWH